MQDRNVAAGTPSEANNETAAATLRDRVAIVVIHGMGEPTPMSTIRDFVTATWETNPDVIAGSKSASTFTVPDWRAGTHEVQRIKTGSAKRTSRTEPDLPRADAIKADFFELYWADLTHNNTWSEFLTWSKMILVRSPSQVPDQVKGIWFGLWAVVFLALILLAIPLVGVLGLKPEDYEHLAGMAFGLALATYLTKQLARRIDPHGLSWTLNLAVRLLGYFTPVLCVLVVAEFLRQDAVTKPTLKWALIALGGLLVLLVWSLKWFLTNYFGDVARYTTALPGNIQARRDIRERGLTLLRNLSQSSKYERIVVVGHSLGCLVAYDLICLLWADFATRSKVPIPNGSALASELDAFAATIAKADTTDNFLAKVRDHQRAVFDHLTRLQPPTPVGPPALPPLLQQWRVSDLVTIANALTHAEFLLAFDQEAFAKRIERRELATCPPMLENENLTYTYGSQRLLRHDVPFSCVRWSGIYDPPKAVLTGDFISGPAGHLFGVRTEQRVLSGLLEIAVKPRRIGGSLPARLFTHNDYWSQPPPRTDLKDSESVKAIRHVVNALDTDAAETKARAMAKARAANKRST